MDSARPEPRRRTPENRVDSAVYSAQVAAVFRQMPIALVVNLVNAALVALTLNAPKVDLLPAIWFGVVAVITFGRGLLWWRYRRTESMEDARWWSVSATVASFLSGLSWGVGGAALLPLVPQLAQFFVTIVIAGMCTGAVVLNASRLPVLVGFVLAACLPMAASFLTVGTPIDHALGAMILVFVAAMVLAGKHYNRIFCESMRLGFELDEANRRLHAEIAKHRATEAALRQAQKLEAIGHLTGGIAHDFNNLLTVVIGNLVMAQERIGENSAVASLIENAAQAAERGVTLIHRLLGFARKQRLDPQPVDLGRLLASMKEMLSSTLGPQIQLLLEIPPGTAPAEIDADQLALAILNLAINARDAMPEGGRLRIGIDIRGADAIAPRELADGDYVIVEIADTGIGIDEATLAQAFDPFFTTKELGVGTGLGLPTVQGFVAQSGGAVRLSSQPGVGTTVELWLPVAKGPPRDASSPIPPTGTRSEPPSAAAGFEIPDDGAGVRRYVGDHIGAIG